MAFESNKISNILGTKLPQWLINQLGHRSNQGSRDFRDNGNVLFLSNKTAWVRVVSSINVYESDINYFNKIIGGLQNPEDLAKEFVLFGGTSKYLNQNAYQQRSGLGKDGAYGILGNEEIKEFGYRPMPGLTSVVIDTQGRLGSLRSATITFRCWDKSQLDIIDALYFKLGFMMLLEWGNTFFYKNNSNRLESSEIYSIDPFAKNISKEEIAVQISRNVRKSEGNYDALLGMVTNFNFSYNQEGGFDCTLKVVGLGILGDAIKINNVGVLPNILKDEILLLSNTLLDISRLREPEAAPLETAEQFPNDLLQAIVKYRRLQVVPLGERLAKGFTELTPTIFNTISFRGTEYYSRDAIKEFRRDIKNERLSYLKIPSNIKTGPITTSDIDKTPAADFYNFDYFFKNQGDGGSNIYVLSRYNLIVDGGRTTDYTGVDLNASRIKSIINSVESQNFTKNPSPELLQNNTQLRGGRQTLVGYTFNTTYNGSLSDSKYNLAINIDNVLTDATIESVPVGTQNLISKEDIKKELTNLLNNLAIGEGNYNIKLESIEDDGSFKVSLLYPTTKKSVISSSDFYQKIRKTEVPAGSPPSFTVESKGFIKFEFIFNDSVLLSGDIKSPPDPNLNLFDIVDENIRLQDIKNAEAAAAEEQRRDQEARSTQIQQALSSQSAIELTLRTIQVHALNRAIEANKGDLEIGRKVYTLSVANDTVSGKPFYTQIFSSGIYANIINDLIKKDGIDDSLYSREKSISDLDRLKIYSKYGFVSELLSGKESIESFKGFNVDYEELLKAYVIPYQISQEIVKGVSINHPVYINLGFLLMLLNHNCTIYDSNEAKENQTPLVYLDYNPNLNFFLTNAKQLSTNPFKVLIPFEGVFEDYKKLFPEEILNEQKTAILPPSGSTENIPLFNPDNDDLLSSQIPPIKSDNEFKGRLMNVLLNIDYLIELIRDYSYKDGSNSIYLKTFLEQLILDINKHLGNFNALRVSYNDSANTYQIVDDQVMPPTSDEQILQPDNISEIPLVGLNSIARNLEIKTEISSKLASMIAISANADVPGKATLSLNGDNFGFVNTNYKDRFVLNRGEVNKDKSKALETVKNSAAQFNQTVSDFYSKINPSEANVSHATNYYIEKMTNIKNDDFATRAATMIPVSVNFTTDGISGLTMGQAFTISDQLLPYTYNNRKIEGEDGLKKDHINKVGFVITGLTNTIENNQWTTSVKANMIFLKYATEFKRAVQPKTRRDGSTFGVNPLNALDSISVTDNSLTESNFTNYPVVSSIYSNIKFTKSNLGNPAEDSINPRLLQDINNAAILAGITVTVTTGVSGHSSKTSTGAPSRHATGNAVDIAIVDGIAVRDKTKIGPKVEQFTQILRDRFGYAFNVESGNRKAVLTYGFKNHDNHIHISNLS